ncbi:MAG: family 16 glycoside hydrolase [Pirellulaceae bacterium]
MHNTKLKLLACLLVTCVTAVGRCQEKVFTTLLIDGQNNHNWQQATPMICATLESTGRFKVDVATAPPAGGDMSKFNPKFADYDVVVSNYNGEPWSEATQNAFVDYVYGGGGFVCVHAANNSFPKWAEYNQMIGLGGWGGRTEKDGPYVRWRDDKFVRDTQPGRGGSHGKRHEFEVVVRDTDHPITRGIPTSFLQAEDELYAELRGPAKDMDVLATAYSDPATGGTGENEPIMMVVDAGKGRVFHTTLGHDAVSQSGAAFQVTLQRGTEWAASGQVTQPAVTAALLSNKTAVTRDPATLTKPGLQQQADASMPPVDFSKQPDINGEGWTPIFNGKDLSGWSQKNGLATYTVEDGAVLGRSAKNSPNSFMCSDRDYSDFELTFEVKVDPQLNSGVQIRSKSLPDVDNGRVHGPQIEIEGGEAEAGYVYGEATGRGWLSPHQPPTKAMKDNEWNRFVIRAVGTRIQTWINGQQIEDIADPDSYLSGFLGLQVHGVGDRGPFEVRWRDIRIHEIK